MKDKKVIAVDFDGVLHSFGSGWSTDISDPPTPGAITWLSCLITASNIFKIVIFSSRNEDAEGVDAMKSWLLYYGLSERHLLELEFPTEKPAYHLLIDDRCFCYIGKFPTIPEINEFVPWHGNGVW